MVFFQSKDLTDGKDTTIGPMVIGYSICHTIDQIGHIRRVNGELKFENCYYVLFSRKRAPNFSRWPESITKKLQSNDVQSDERTILVGKDIMLGGYFCVDGEIRNNCLGQTFSTFVCRPNDSNQEISQTLDHIHKVAIRGNDSSEIL